MLDKNREEQRARERFSLIHDSCEGDIKSCEADKSCEATGYEVNISSEDIEYEAISYEEAETAFGNTIRK